MWVLFFFSPLLRTVRNNAPFDVSYRMSVFDRISSRQFKIKIKIRCCGEPLHRVKDRHPQTRIQPHDRSGFFPPDLPSQRLHGERDIVQILHRRASGELIDREKRPLLRISGSVRKALSALGGVIKDSKPRSCCGCVGGIRGSRILRAVYTRARVSQSFPFVHRAPADASK